MEKKGRGEERKRGRKEEEEKGKVLHKRLFEISFFYYVKRKEKELSNLNIMW